MLATLKNKSIFILLNYKVILLYFLLLSYSTNIKADTTINSSKFSTSISPELIYRKAYIDLNKKSIYYDDKYKNYTDQIYVSLKLSKTYNYVNEVLVDPVIRSKKFNPSETEILLAQAYVNAYINSKVFFSFGKKLEFEGSGFFINPSDLANERKDLYDPLNQKEGQFISRIGYQGDLITTSLTIFPNRKNDIEESTILYKTYMNIWNMDTSFQYSFNKTNKSTFGLSLNRFWSDYIETHAEARYQQRQRGTDEERERPFSSLQEEDSSVFALAGIRSVFTSKRSLILEYIFKQSGLNKEQTTDFMKQEEIDREESHQDISSSIIGKQYVFLAYNDEDTIKRTKISLSGLYNISDKSSFINLDVNYTVSSIISVSLSPMFNIGSSYTEFGEAYLKNVCYLIIRGTF